MKPLYKPFSGVRFIISALTIIYVLTIAVQTSAQTTIDSLKNVLRKTNSTKAKIPIEIELSGYLIVNNRLGEAEKYLQKSIVESKAIGNRLHEIKALNLLGIIAKNRNQFQKSQQIYGEALRMADSEDFPAERANILSNLGINEYEMGNYNKAINYHLEAYKLREKISDSIGVAKSETSIGNIYFIQKNYTKALKYYRNAVKINQKLNFPFQIGILQNNIGLIYLAKKDYKQAEQFFEKAYKTTIKINDIEGQADAFIGLGEVQLFKKNYDEAAKFINASLAIYEKLNYKKRMAECYQMLGSMSVEINQLEKAFYYFNKQLILAKEIGNKENIKTGYKSLSDYYKRKKNYKQALAYYELYSSVKDSLLNEANSKNLAEQEIKFQTEKKQKENEVLAQKNNYLFQKNKAQHLEIVESRYFITALVLSVLFVLIFGFLLIKFNRAKAKNKQIEIEQKLLRSQMNPHFIFNAMVGIQNFIYKEEPETAANYLSSIVSLMRSILENSQREKIVLEKEIETLHHYLTLQQVRHDQKFDFTIEVAPELEVENLFIPPMMAQPVIENAVEHGIMHVANKRGHILVQFKMIDKNVLSVVVEDNGIGRKKAKQINQNKETHLSVATAITEERLAMMNRKTTKKSSMIIEDLVDANGEAIGTRVTFNFHLESKL